MSAKKNGSGFDNLVIRLDNHGAVFVLRRDDEPLRGMEKDEPMPESDAARGML